MSTEDGFDFIFDRLLIESEQEEDDDTENYADSLVYPLAESDESGSEHDEKEGGDDVGDDKVGGEWSNQVIAYDPWTFEDSQIGVNKRFLIGCKEPVHFYELFMLGIWDLVARETNRYGQEHDQLWEQTSIEEIKRFIALCIQMGIVRLPRLRDYWSSCSIFGPNLASKVMKEERFEKLLTNIHLANSASYDGKDRLYKITSLVEIVNRNCSRVYKPGEEIYINESLVPFRGVVSSPYGIPQTKHKFGVKLFKLCSKGGYTYRILVHAGRGLSETESEAESVVMRLMADLIDDGRVLYADDWCTSISIAERLVQRKTHLIGKCKTNRKGLPRQMIRRKLKKGQLDAQQNRNGVMVLKWRDKNDIVMISTTHDAALSATSSRPQVVESYYQAKLSVDSGSYMTSYSPYVRRTSKWYIRLFFHLVTHTCLMNAWKIYCENVQTISFDEFKIQVYFGLVLFVHVPTTSTITHVLEETSEKKWRRCAGCYRKAAKIHDSATAIKRAKQVSTMCSQCNKHFCLDCFNNSHRKCIV